jgi:hypothetical protein
VSTVHTAFERMTKISSEILSATSIFEEKG